MSITMTPQASIRLVNVPFESDEKHNLYFADKKSQLAYFNGLEGYTFADYTYIKKDSAIKIALNYELVKNYNYLYYNNYQQTISDKGLTADPRTVFCYIVDKEYVNENTTKLYIKTDNFQTYLTEILSDKSSISYIERQHLSKAEDYILGASMIDEGLETGDYIQEAVVESDVLSGNKFNCLVKGPGSTDYTHEEITLSEYLKGLIIIGVTNPQIGKLQIPGNYSSLGGSFHGLHYLVFSTVQSARQFLDYASANGQAERIYTVFMLPAKYAEDFLKTTFTDTVKIYVDEGNEQSITYSFTFFTPLMSTLSSVEFGTMVMNINNYTKFRYITEPDNSYDPHNNKVLQSPYHYMLLSDSNGNVNKLDYELFKDRLNATLSIQGSFAQGGSIICVPKDYKGQDTNYDELITLTKYPTCSWNTDSYVNWLTQTAVQRNNSADRLLVDRKVSRRKAVVNGVLDLAGQIISLFNPVKVKGGGFTTRLGSGSVNPAGEALSGAGGIYNSVEQFAEAGRTYDRGIEDLEAQRLEHSLVPNAIGNGSAAPDVMFSLDTFKFKVQHMGISGERAKQIDEYFDRFGYAVNKNDNLYQAITSRSKWNYIKTVDCVLKADIPDENLNEIKAMFNNGITIWKNPSEIYRYDLGAENV